MKTTTLALIAASFTLAFTPAFAQEANTSGKPATTSVNSNSLQRADNTATSSANDKQAQKAAKSSSKDKKAQKDTTSKKDIVKTGYNLGPLPVIAYDNDKGLQLGAILQLFNYGDGHNYPNYDSKWYLEGSFFTKGSTLVQLMYDDKELIPGVRWSSAVSCAYDSAMDFFGFNGYQAFYDFDRIKAGKDKESSQSYYNPYYKMDRLQILYKTDFIGNITKKFKWEAGYHGAYFNINTTDFAAINKGKEGKDIYDDATCRSLYDDYVDWGLISKEEALGGWVSSIRAGLCYDGRDKEGAPTRGIWAEGHVSLAPKWLGNTVPFYRYSLTFRHYVPIVKNDVLTFAYRLNYEGTFGDNAPFYVLPYITVMGENSDKDGMGGYRTLRGIMRDKVVGLDMFTYVVELRYRFVKFKLWKQNMSFAANIFGDGSIVTRGRDLSYKGADDATIRARYEAYMKSAPMGDSDRLHATIGAGLRFIMNENFIFAVEYGLPISYLMPKDCAFYGQDGTGAFYVNVGYLF